MQSEARARVTRARTSLVLDQPFFGVLALRLRLVEDPGCGTAWTDGRSLGFDPEFVDSLSRDDLLGLVAHEVLHCAAGHPWRRDGRDPKAWNVAADHAINHVLRDAGFSLPEGALCGPEYAGRSAEWIYARLPQDQGGQGKGDEEGESGSGESGSGEGTPNPQGEVRDAPDDVDPEENASEADWNAAAQQAARVASAQGKLPAALSSFAKERADAVVDWRNALRRFCQERAAEDFSWSMPSARYLARGLYLPARQSEGMGPILVAVDNSGSIDHVALAQFEAELQSIADELRPRVVYVVACDTRVNVEAEFLQDEPISLDVPSGGGTDFRPVFEYAQDLPETPACIVYLTDLYGTFPATSSIPTLWATSTRDYPVPFGEVVAINT